MPLPFIRTALEQVPGIPGRLERIDRGQPFTVLVDYAHTPDSLENVLAHVPRLCGRAVSSSSSGAGAIGTKKSARVWAKSRLDWRTSSSLPRTTPAANGRRISREDIEDGVFAGAAKSPGDYEVIVERRDAIRRAIEAARPGDIVLIAGKGHETTQVFHDRTIHFDDREEAARALKERFGDGSADA